MKHFESYEITNGKLQINNSEIKIVYKEVKYFLETLKLLGAIAMIGTFAKKVNDFENITGVFEFIKFGLFGIASIYLIYLFFIIIFKRIWKNKIELNELIKVEIEDGDKDDKIDEDSKIEVTFFKNNERSKTVNLKRKHNQLEPFLKEVKKRNSRIKIKYVV